MNVLNKENLKSILKPFKEKMDSCITREQLKSELDNCVTEEQLKSELDNCVTEEQLKSELDNYVTEDNATVNNTLSIKNNETISILSTNDDYVRLSIGENYLDLTTDGKFIVNGKNLLSTHVDKTIVDFNEINITPYTKNKDMLYKMTRGSAVSIGDNIYLLGGDSDTSGRIYNCKYDTILGNYTKNKDIPYDFVAGSAVAIGTSIYLLGGNSTDSSCYNYKYDTITDTYTKNKNIPYYFSGGSAVAIGNIIYLLGTTDPYTASNKINNYKYDTITNTYSKNTKIPYEFYRGSAVSIGNDIYLLGSNHTNNGSYIYSKYNYKYDTTTDTYSKNKDIPYEFYNGSAVVIENNIYVLGGTNDSNSKYNYKYNTTTDTYIQMTNIPYRFYNGSAVSIGTDIYLFGSKNEELYLNNYKYDTIDYTGRVTFKKTGHSIYTNKLNYYTSEESKVIYMEDDELYVEYDENNNLIRNDFSPNGTGKLLVYGKMGGKLNSKNLPDNGWCYINVLDYM